MTGSSAQAEHCWLARYPVAGIRSVLRDLQVGYYDGRAQAWLFDVRLFLTVSVSQMPPSLQAPSQFRAESSGISLLGQGLGF
jgi:hypothetical protein